MADAFLGVDGPGDPNLGGFDMFDPASTAAWADTVDATSDLDGDGIRDTVAFDHGHGALVVTVPPIGSPPSPATESSASGSSIASPTEHPGGTGSTKVRSG